MEADPVGVQRHTVPRFKDLFKIFKVRYSMYSDGIMFKFLFQKSHFTPVSVYVYVDALRGGKVGIPTGILPHVRGWRSW